MPYHPFRKTTGTICMLVLFLVTACCLKAQTPSDKSPFRLVVVPVHKDTLFDFSALRLRTSFDNALEAEAYLSKLLPLMYSKGFPAASIDSIIRTDSSFVVYLYAGKTFRITLLDVSGFETSLASSVLGSGNKQRFVSMGFHEISRLQEKILGFYENNGYPFASVKLDSIVYGNNEYSARLKTDKGRFYPIDSIRVFGNVRIRNVFLQRYLGIMNGSGYNRSSLQLADKRISGLNFLKAMQPSDLTMLGDGAVLNLYLKNIRSNQFNFLAGLMPSSPNTGKLLLTGDLNMDCRNMLGYGERILFKWQQLQPSSPRLVLGYNQPYLFGSDYAMDLQFELFRKDSGFLQVNAGIGTQYAFSAEKKAGLYLQWQSNRLLSGGVDTILVKVQRKLPDNSDLSTANLGFSYQWNNTDYRLNPRKGYDVELSGVAGLKKINRNSDIISLKDTGFVYASLYDSIRLNSYLFRFKLSASRFFPLGRSAALKTTVSSGMYYSPEIFRNDLFQIGGYRLMRGFDEESIYATRYGVLTAEYRILFSTNSFLAFFSDYGMVRFKYRERNVAGRFLGLGTGIVLETKAGLLNLSYAVGFRDDVRFSLRSSSKIHFGYINYF